MSATEKENKLSVPDFEEQILKLEQGRELIDSCRRSPLPWTDIAYVLEDILENYPPNPLLVEGYIALLNHSSTEKVRRKIEERESAEEVDLMETMAVFSNKEITNILQNLRSLQMTDGCTIGCPWCAGCAQRTIEKKFSLSSYRWFLEKYGAYLTNPIYLYFNSDPFDWVEGEYSYLDLIYALAENNIKVSLSCTSTSVPGGTEISIIRFLEALYFVWQQKENKTPFRFSKTKENFLRIQQIISILRAKGLNEKFIKSLRIVKRYQGGGVRNLGYFIKHPDRDEIKDAEGIDDFDGIYLAPHKGFYSVCLESVTTQNPTGIREQLIFPGSQEIPFFVNKNDYGNPSSTIKEGGIPLLPEITYQLFENGGFVGTKTVPSVRRDILTFLIVTSHLNKISKEIKTIRGKPDSVKNLLPLVRLIRKKFQPEYERRKRICLEKCETETDQEAVRTARKLIQIIDKWLGIEP